MRGTGALKGWTFSAIAIVAIIFHAYERDPGKKEIEFAAADAVQGRATAGHESSSNIAAARSTRSR